jgi:hypothetical protein
MIGAAHSGGTAMRLSSMSFGRLLHILALAVLAMALPLVAAPDRASAAEGGGGGHLAELAAFVDKATPAAERQRIFEAWRQAALAGDADAQYVVGSIYRRGDAIEPHVVERNADQAGRYLSTAAAHGRVLAMAKMAELELAEDRPLEAAIWAQVFGAYRGWNDGSQNYGPHDERQPSFYFEDLLRRTSSRVAQKLGNGQTPNILAGLNQFVAEHDKDVRAQMIRSGISPRWASGQAKLANAKSMRQLGTDLHNAVSEWVLVFGADGSTVAALAFDTIPNLVDASRHHGSAMQFEAAPVKKDAPVRYALKTLELRRSGWLEPMITR